MPRSFATAIPAAALPASGAEYPAKVVGITDGDTVTVLTAAKQQVKVRLQGIDCPESGQDFGSRAKQAASAMAFGKQVTIRTHGTDRYGRTLSDVILPDGRSLNHELVRQGMAWWYRPFAPGDRELERLEAEARASKRDLWSQPHPVPPWTWRRGEGVPPTAEVIAHRRSKVYHRPTCPEAVRMSDANRVRFNSASEAEAAGVRRAGDCK